MRAKIKTGFWQSKVSTKVEKLPKIPYTHFLRKTQKPKPALPFLAIIQFYAFAIFVQKVEIARNRWWTKKLRFLVHRLEKWRKCRNFNAF